MDDSEIPKKREFNESELAAFLDVTIDIALNNGIIDPCEIQVVRDGRKFIELGYKITDESVYQRLLKLSYGGE